MSENRQILQASAWYLPQNVGGTENYLEGLITGLSHRGFENVVLTPRARTAPEEYDYNGTKVETYPVNEEAVPDERDGAPHQGFDQFCSRLSAHSGAIYHQHSWTRGLGLQHLRAARQAGHPTVLTVHTPNVNCLRSSMVRYGEVPCDGLIELGRCGACWAQGRGAPLPLAKLMARLPVPARLQSSSRLATALSARALARQKRADFRAMTVHADRVVAVCRWLYDALLINGVPQEKLRLSRQGIGAPAFADVAPARVEGALRLLYLGRWHRTKGVEVAVKAIAMLPPDMPVTLTIHGVAAGPDEIVYRGEILKIIGKDPRIIVKDGVSPSEVPALLRQFDVMLVPSQWMETGPLVVLEAQAAGLFVIGSRLGGIAELVDDQDGGLLVPPKDGAAWARAILDVARRPRPLARPRTVRSMDAAAADMALLYEELLSTPARKF